MGRTKSFILMKIQHWAAKLCHTDYSQSILPSLCPPFSPPHDHPLLSPLLVSFKIISESSHLFRNLCVTCLSCGDCEGHRI